MKPVVVSYRAEQSPRTRTEVTRKCCAPLLAPVDPAVPVDPEEPDDPDEVDDPVEPLVALPPEVDLPPPDEDDDEEVFAAIVPFTSTRLPTLPARSLPPSNM
jgi:hypothetical protein